MSNNTKKKTKEIGQMYTLDETERKILRELVNDSRQSFRNIAKKLGMHTTTVINKYNRFKKDGLIRGTSLSVDYDKLGYTLTAIIEVKFLKYMLTEDIVQNIKKKHNVCAMYNITGETDIIIIARFRTTKELDEFLHIINAVEGISHTNTHIVLNTFKEDFVCPI